MARSLFAPGTGRRRRIALVVRPSVGAAIDPEELRRRCGHAGDGRDHGELDRPRRLVGYVLDRPRLRENGQQIIAEADPGGRSDWLRNRSVHRQSSLDDRRVMIDVLKMGWFVVCGLRGRRALGIREVGWLRSG
jgi:hypothetical protein